MAGRHRALPVGLLLAAVWAVTGCSPAGVPMTPSSTEPAPATATPSGWPSSRPPLQTTAPLPSGAPAEVSPERWQALVDHLAGRQITGTPVLESAEAVTWQDSSLGCPSPGVSYTQAQVDGMRVIVTVDGERYDFRFGNGTDLKLCSARR